MTHNERIYGFSCRDTSKRFHDNWTLNRRNEYLLRKDVKLPLSVDRGVWPSIFEVIKDLEQPDEVKTFGYWQTLDAMQNFLLLNQKQIATSFNQIAMTCVLDGKVETQWLDNYASKLDKSYPFKQFVRLGYDVADSYLLSGLANCGYTPDDLASLGSWVSKLNSQHLFGNAKDAIEYANLTDQRVPEHSPFHSFGIYLIS